mmetsp:Transcript_17038/g.19649  ORF Transcript_17038/g.19649 Transcript_17038/m.19649 type:complete len:97 (-) Transcript_17038:1273-1563(-)
MKNLRCKGGKPASITVKVASKNPIINSMDIQSHETSLQKEIMEKSRKAQEEDKKLGKINEENEDDSEEDVEELKRIEGISEPKHKIVYSYPIEMGD